MRLIDANVILRFLVEEEAETPMAQRARALFARVNRNEEKILILRCVIFEVVYVLEKFYKTQRKIIADILAKIIRSKGVSVPGKNRILNALEKYASINVDFVDCYLAGVMELGDIKEIYSFDRDLDKLGVKRLVPELETDRK